MLGDAFVWMPPKADAAVGVPWVPAWTVATSLHFPRFSLFSAALLRICICILGADRFGALLVRAPAPSSSPWLAPFAFLFFFFFRLTLFLFR